MPVVSFPNEDISITAAAGTTILEAARAAGVTIESPCNGAGVCAKCKVRLEKDSLLRVLHGTVHRLSEKEEAAGYVLACEALVQGDVVVYTEKQKGAMRILNHGISFGARLDSFIRKIYDPKEGITRIFGGDEELGMEGGDTAGESYGVVVDIGTTTLVASLVDIRTGEELDSRSALNPQAIHAQDVLSRIKLASEESGLRLMHIPLRDELNRMIAELAEQNRIVTKRIYEVVFSGNTCMLHLAANINPGSLGRFPYSCEISGGFHLKAADYGLTVSDFGVVYLPPVISAYVGADITSGVLASQLHKRKGATLFVDIGTNGEMVIGLDGRLAAASTAAGPAFEGMNILHGMRAGKGAIEYFNVEADGTIDIRTIGDTEAVGICGSGLLDIAGELAAYGVINRNGKFADPDTEELLPVLRERIEKLEGKPAFRITENVCLTQKDVRQVQLAKGAVRAGIELLLKSRGLSAQDVDSVLIAGSFGYHLRAKSLINIGLLPPEFEGKIDFIGNTSKSGGHAMLVNQSYRSEMEELVNSVEVVELANCKDFDKVFVSCLGF